MQTLLPPAPSAPDATSQGSWAPGTPAAWAPPGCPRPGDSPHSISGAPGALAHAQGDRPALSRKAAPLRDETLARHGSPPQSDRGLPTNCGAQPVRPPEPGRPLQAAPALALLTETPP